MTAMPFTSWGKRMLAGDFPSSRKNTHSSACWRSDHAAGAAVRGYRGMVAVHAPATAHVLSAYPAITCAIHATRLFRRYGSQVDSAAEFACDVAI